MCHDTYSKLYETFGTMVYRVTLYLCTVNKSDYYHFKTATNHETETICWLPFLLLM